MTHKLYVNKILYSFDALWPIFAVNTTMSWHALLTAVFDEMKSEVAWAISRGTSRAKGKSIDRVMNMKNPFKMALTTAEFENLTGFVQIERGCVYMTNQSPWNWFAIRIRNRFDQDPTTSGRSA